MQLELKLFEEKGDIKYKIVDISDIAFHRNRRPTEFPGKKLQDCIEKQEPGRVYSLIDKHDDLDSKSILLKVINHPDFIRMVKEEEEKGFKVLLNVPSPEIPRSIGKETVEFSKSIKGKRILRRLYSGKGKE